MAKFANKEVAAKFEAENGARHRKLDAMRKLGSAFVVGGGLTAEFEALYAEEAAWLKANNIQFTPSEGWHEKTA